MKIVTFLGIRPDLIRMVKLLRLLDKGQKKYGYEHIFVHSGQHFDYQLDGLFYEEMGIRKPDINLGVGKELKESGKPTSHAYQTALLYEKTAEMLEKVKPDLVMYLGDTNTILSSVVVARYGIPVVHIEGGGRSYDWRMPEEKNRTVIDHLSDMIYCYLPRYRDILLKEGIPPYRIKDVGNIIVDPINEFDAKAEATDALKKVGVKSGQYCLSTIHREENTSTKAALTEKMRGLIKISKDMPVVLPVMPRVKAMLQKTGLDKELEKSNVITTEPLGFLEFMKLEKHAKLIVSDSGTVQEEALVFGVPCLITRLSTERPETMEAGATILDNGDVYAAAQRALKLDKNWDRNVLNPYGDGKRSPSEVVFNDLMDKLKTGFFKKSRGYDFVSSDYIVKQAYGKN